MDNMELLCLQIITDVGKARSNYIEAIHEAKIGNYVRCNELMKEGNEGFAKGHRTHAKLISKEASGERNEFSLLLVHAEDQLMSAEGFKILCSEFLDIHRKFDALQAEIRSQKVSNGLPDKG